MKKKMLAVIIAVLGIAVAAAGIYWLMPLHKDGLSRAGLARARKQYPTIDVDSGAGDKIELSLEEFIERLDCFLVVEIVGEPTSYVKDLGVYGRSTHMKHEAKVLNDYLGNVPQETLGLTYNIRFADGMPEMKPGERYVVGGLYYSEEDMVSISSDIMFYVTEEDCVMSVVSEESRNRHSGKSVEALGNYVAEVKNGQ